jgi:hypothetical protein
MGWNGIGQNRTEQEKKVPSQYNNMPKHGALYIYVTSAVYIFNICNETE